MWNVLFPSEHVTEGTMSGGGNKRSVINEFFDSGDSSIAEKKTKKFKKIRSFDSSDDEKQAEPMENGYENRSSENKFEGALETSNYDRRKRRQQRKSRHDAPAYSTEERRKMDRDRQMASLRERRSQKCLRAKENNNNEEFNSNAEFTESNVDHGAMSSSDSNLDVPRKKCKKTGPRFEDSETEEFVNKQVNDQSEAEPPHCSKSTRKEPQSKKQSAHSFESEYLKFLSEEQTRMRRLDERREMFKNIEDEESLDSSTRLVLDYDEHTKKPLVNVDPHLVSKLKPHQKEGIKFMWDTCFESIEQLKLDRRGGGCILAHSMGLGKSLQVVALIHTLLSHKDTEVKSVLIICPVNTILNWVSEFKKWLADVDGEPIEVYNLPKKLKDNEDRVKYLEGWSTNNNGGVMIMGYDMCQTLLNNKKMKKDIRERVVRALLCPGCDLVVCDEGHVLKNRKSVRTRTLMRMRTMRRILLTGTPMQNNLMEYYCMVNFVRPGYLGSEKWFQNRYGHAITKGQFLDSEAEDVSCMKSRASALNKILSNIVQRCTEDTLTEFLPVKHDFVVLLKLSNTQEKLYSHLLTTGHSIVDNKSVFLFQDFQKMRLVWPHPRAILFRQNGVEKNGSQRRTSTSPGGKEVATGDFKNEEEEGPWWSDFLSDEEMEDPKIGPKVTLLLTMLEECEELGDKMLVFSPSLPSLDVIEYFLKKSDDSGERWVKEVDYFRLDGQTSKEKRAEYCDSFNNPENKRARLFLISTDAGNMGINLQAANRAVIFDASWNPSNDNQAIFRIFRFGQTKETIVYRLVAQATMEEIIVNRQITKVSIARRVVDEDPMNRPYTQEEVGRLYRHERRPPMSHDMANKCATFDDPIMAKLLSKHRDLMVEVRDYDSLLENNPAEELTESERRRADREFTRTQSGDCNLSRVDNVKEKIRSTLTQFNPSATDESALNVMYSRLVEYYDEEKKKGVGTVLSGASGSEANRNSRTTFGSEADDNPMFDMSIRRTREEEHMLIIEQQALLHALTSTVRPLSQYSIPPCHVTRILTRSGWNADILKTKFMEAFKSWSTLPTMNAVGNYLVLHFLIAVRVDTLERKLAPLGITVKEIRPRLETAESLLAGGVRLLSDDKDDE